ncbi:Exosome complex component rrp40 [Galdieria sulphuraria]|nr:Exosome complex component rrp40 [Galdieria sulphuraria]
MIVESNDVFVFPGDKLFKLENGDNIRIGQGVVKRGDGLVALKPGYLHKDGNKIWIETAQKRYIPTVGDLVIGIIVDRSSDFYQVDVGGFSTALLPILAFEGATKRNRPHLSAGSAVYARVVSADRDSEPQLSCLLPGTQHSWVTGETIFGELSQGNLIHCSISLCRNILLGRNSVFTELGKYIPFEQATGMNGRIWKI